MIFFIIFFSHAPQWNLDDTSSGVHWRMLERQGERNMWFIGAGLTFDAIPNIIQYNRLLLRQMATPESACKKKHHRYRHPQQQYPHRYGYQNRQKGYVYPHTARPSVYGPYGPTAYVTPRAYGYRAAYAAKAVKAS